MADEGRKVNNASARRKVKEPKPVYAARPQEKKEKQQPSVSGHKLRRREQRSGCLGGLMYFLFILCLSVALAFFAWMAASDVMALNKRSFSTTVTLPASAFTYEEVAVTADDGAVTTKNVTHADIDAVSDALYRAGLIQYKWLFSLYCRVSNADTRFDPGEYELKSSYDYRALVQNMREGAGGITTVDVTIPEGFTMLDIFTRLEENKVSTMSEFMSAAAGYNFRYDFLDDGSYAGATRLEGYLYPDTYQFYVGMEASSAINKLLNNFYYKFNADMRSQADKMGYSVGDIVTIASIIEKEAKLEDDRAYVASVIYNRLNANMSLGMDTTILYLYQDHEGEPTAEMERVYNTVLKAQMAVLEAARPGVSGKELDGLARTIIAEAGYDGYFSHSLSPGLGIDVHESPYCSTASTDILKKGNVISDEPGIYIPGKFGVRIEDMVLVTEDGYENFCHLTKDLIVL